MPTRSRSGKPDVNQMAANLIDAISGELPSEEFDPSKDAKAIERGHLGGLKGGIRRAEKLSPRKRKQIARKGAHARWHKP